MMIRKSASLLGYASLVLDGLGGVPQGSARPFLAKLNDAAEARLGGGPRHNWEDGSGRTGRVSGTGCGDPAADEHRARRPHGDVVRGLPRALPPSAAFERPPPGAPRYHGRSRLPSESL